MKKYFVLSSVIGVFCFFAIFSSPAFDTLKPFLACQSGSQLSNFGESILSAASSWTSNTAMAMGGRHDGDDGDCGTHSVPEPSTFLLLAAGLGGLALLRKKFRK